MNISVWYFALLINYFIKATKLPETFSNYIINGIAISDEILLYLTQV